MTAAKKTKNPFWNALAKGKATEWIIQSVLLQLAVARNIDLNVYPAALDWAGIDALLVVNHQVFAVAMQGRERRIQLTRGDTPISYLAQHYQTVAMSICSKRKSTVVATHDQIARALAAGNSSVAIEDCALLEHWLEDIASH
jgi:hypothetical protein